jgi:AcrR family transcriptional regulator
MSENAETVKQNILEVATAEFAHKGYSGARVDEIAEKTITSKRMIYYYFKDKEGLYLAVLEAAYARIRAIEATLELEGLAPLAALEKIVRFTFDHHTANTNFVRLVMVENIHHAMHIAHSTSVQSINASVISRVDEIYKRGVVTGVFRQGLTAIDIHASISALCFYNVSNRATFNALFKHDFGANENLAGRREVIVETVTRFVLA